MRRRSLIAAVVLVFAGQASTASASTAFVGPSDKFPDGAAVHYVADPGETNDVRIDFGDPSGVEIRDTGATITAGGGCTSISPNRVRCIDPDNIVEARLGDENDVLRNLLDEEWAVLRGGDGNDRLDGGRNFYGAPEYLFGGVGDDVLRGGDGSDVLDGGPGADLMSGGTSYDVFTAGLAVANDDKVTYARRTARVRSDADVEAADDGERGEGDTIMADVEVIVGGKGNDVLGGATTNFSCCDGPKRLIGMVLEGRAGDDILRGTRGRDLSIKGGSGNDMLRGAEGDDRLSGGAGDDTLAGDKGRDRLQAGRGDDSLRARDGQQDHVNGGPGRDEARIDAAIDHIRNIEKIL
jgi:hemolysin type calcium-binding protein